MARARVQWDDKALRHLIGDTARPGVIDATRRSEAAANALGSAFRTGLYHRNHRSPAVGNTPAHYSSDVEDYDGIPVGLVYTGNYAATRDNSQNNTLAKALG